jgi:hypothetical protein
MAKPIVVVLEESETIFSFVKLDRAKLYGTRRRIILGPNNDICQRAQLIEDGSTGRTPLKELFTFLPQKKMQR